MTQDEIRTEIAELEVSMADTSRVRGRLQTALACLNNTYMNMWKRKNSLERKLVPVKKLPTIMPRDELATPTHTSPEDAAKKAVASMDDAQMAEFLAALAQMGTENGNAQ